MPEHSLPVKTYFVVCGALLALTALTVAAANLELGPWNFVVALGIAALKASLVVIYFMHARFGTPLVRLTIAASLIWLGILVAGTLNDVTTRGWLGVPGR